MHFIVLMLLAMASGVAGADWVLWEQLIGASGDGYNVYVDPTAIRRSGDMVKMWHMNDFKTLQIAADKKHFSQKAQQEYDCKDKRKQILFVTSHSGNMGSGEVVDTFRGAPGNWTPVVAEGVDEALLKFACAKQ